MEFIFEKAYPTASIHSASWGSSYNGFNIYSFGVDKFTFDNDDFVVVIAAGNDGDEGPRTIGAPATAKNCIAVGASLSKPQQDELVYFSSRGPTMDGRIKPDIVAPGVWTKSAKAMPDKVGGADTSVMSGTSMATPMVAGAAAVVRDYFKQGFYPTGVKSSIAMDISAATVKAVIVNGGVMMGQTSQIRNNDQGFGRLELSQSIPLKNTNYDFGIYISQDENVRQGQETEYSFSVNSVPDCSLSRNSVTLVWNDPPAPTSCSSNW